MTTQHSPKNYQTFLLWSVGFIVAATVFPFVFSLLAALSPWHSTRVLLILLAYVSGWCCAIYSTVALWKGIQAFGAASKVANEGAGMEDKNEINT